MGEAFGKMLQSEISLHFQLILNNSPNSQNSCSNFPKQSGASCRISALKHPPASMQQILIDELPVEVFVAHQKPSASIFPLG